MYRRTNVTDYKDAYTTQIEFLTIQKRYSTG